MRGKYLLRGGVGGLSLRYMSFISAPAGAKFAKNDGSRPYEKSRHIEEGNLHDKVIFFCR
jgi:hypothetical protein